MASICSAQGLIFGTETKQKQNYIAITLMSQLRGFLNFGSCEVSAQICRKKFEIYLPMFSLAKGLEGEGTGLVGLLESQVWIEVR